MDFRGKKVAVLGLGIEGQDVVQFLAGQGAQIKVFDRKDEAELDLPPITNHLSLITGPDYLKDGLLNFDYIIRSPGVRPDLPEILAAKEKGVKVTTAVNIFFELCPCTIIGVTGTKGKGTTASLIHECLVASGKTSYLAGNIGTPYLELLTKLKKSDVVVLEMSSFQLIDIEKSPHVAVVINITTDHMDWHTNREEYVEAKTNIVHYQTKNDFAVLMRDYETSASFEKYAKGQVLWASIKGGVRGAYVAGGKIWLNVDKPVEIGEVDKLILRGRHNWENVVCAIPAAYVCGATITGIKKAVFSFKGLPHRLEKVGEVGGITFYNDSFATSPGPTLAAVRSFNEPIILILGGSSKKLSYKEMAEELTKTKNLKAVLVIGEVGPEIRRELEKVGYAGKLIEGGKDMKEVVSNAVSVANSGDVVILSPAAASFDMFKDYKDRGKQFMEEVTRLK